MATSVPAASVKKVVIACEAGMGSSLMAANKLKQMSKKAGLSVKVEHSPVRSIPQDAQVVFCHEGLIGMAREKAPWAVCFAFRSFASIPGFDRLVATLQAGSDVTAE